MAAYNSWCFRSSSLPWYATLGLFLVLAQSSSFGFVTILVTLSSAALILCPVIVHCRTKSSSKAPEESSSLPSEEVFLEQKVQQQEKRSDSTTEDCLLSSSDALSDSESNDDETSSSDENSENDWIFKESIGQSSLCSDGSISDEESLIEIELPTSHYADSKWYGVQSWMEMVNEMNEENFIEIDLCMGSIKCSRFAIEA
ncbi:hypothetical protein vseg_015338 [Gypsophila vaccaria]